MACIKLIDLSDDQVKRLLAQCPKNGQPLDRTLARGRAIKETLFAAQEPPDLVEICFQSHRDAALFYCPFELIASGDLYYVESDKHVVRVFERDSAIAPVHPLDLPIRVLIVVASPQNMERIDLEEIKNDTRRALRSCFGEDSDEHPISRVTILHGPNTLDQLSKLSQGVHIPGYDLVEIVAHGYRDRDGAKLVLEGNQSMPLPVTAGALYAHLAGQFENKPRLIVVNSCKSSGGIRPGPGQLSSIAWQLLEHEAPAVVAMQEDVSIGETYVARRAFYAGLFRGELLSQCLSLMRKPLQPLWYAPILAVRADVELDIFSEEASRYLKQLNKWNDDVDHLIRKYMRIRTDDALKELVMYLTTIQRSSSPDGRQLQLLDQREEIADMLIEDVAKELNVRL